uniref:POF1B actin binding protein n=1 Tax=Chelydra serpentina TaxID=8475 RepID=A0A8C3RMH9_CHESE
MHTVQSYWHQLYSVVLTEGERVTDSTTPPPLSSAFKGYNYFPHSGASEQRASGGKVGASPPGLCRSARGGGSLTGGAAHLPAPGRGGGGAAPCCGESGEPPPLQGPLPHQHHQHQDGNVVYERVRTYSCPGGRRGQVLEPAPCSPRAVSPLENATGHQHVMWSRDPPQQVHGPPSPSLACLPSGLGRGCPRLPSCASVDMVGQRYSLYVFQSPELQEPLSPFLRGGSYGSGNNVIYEKTIRKYELLNPEQICQQPEQPQIIHQCRETQSCSPCEISSISVSDGGRGTNTVQRVTILGCEPLDSRYFGELLAEVNRKSNDLYSCLLQHVEKIGRREFRLTNPNRQISLIPKGLSELTKQQIRYLLQMRVTSDKSLRLVLSTFGSLREELCHLQDDLGKLETDKMLLEKDLAFKESQVKEYETLLASVRENNRQQQQGLRDSAAKCRSLEEQIISLRYAEGEKDCQLKELEYCKRALEQEIQNLRMKTCSNPVIQTTTDELSSRYVEMINNLREDKDREIRNLRSQVNQFQQDISRRDGSNSDFQMRLHELTSMLEEKETFIKQQQEVKQCSFVLQFYKVYYYTYPEDHKKIQIVTV